MNILNNETAIYLFVGIGFVCGILIGWWLTRKYYKIRISEVKRGCNVAGKEFSETYENLPGS